MKKVSVVIALLISTLGFSQDGKKLLDEVAKKVNSYHNIYVEFDHKLKNEAAKLDRTSRGNATLKKDLYHFNYMGVEQLFDGQKVYLIIHEDEEVIIKKPNNNEDVTTLSPSKMLTFYEKGFTYEMDILQNVKGRKIQYVKLTPINSDSDLKQILVGVDNRTKHIYKIIETGIDDTVTTYTISKFDTNQSISDKLFTFDKDKFESKGYDITEPK